MEFLLKHFIFISLSGLYNFCTCSNFLLFWSDGFCTVSPCSSTMLLRMQFSSVTKNRWMKCFLSFLERKTRGWKDNFIVEELRFWQNKISLVRDDYTQSCKVRGSRLRSCWYFVLVTWNPSRDDSWVLTVAETPQKFTLLDFFSIS